MTYQAHTLEFEMPVAHAGRYLNVDFAAHAIERGEIADIDIICCRLIDWQGRIGDVVAVDEDRLISDIYEQHAGCIIEAMNQLFPVSPAASTTTTKE